MTATAEPPSRASLRARVTEACAELSRLRCTDHAAREAMLTVRLTEHTLVAWWLPAIDGRRDG